MEDRPDLLSDGSVMAMGEVIKVQRPNQDLARQVRKHSLEGEATLTRLTMMHIIRKHPSTSSPLLPIIRDTVLVTPIAPSPMTMRVRRDMRSMRWVFLKLNILQKQDMAMTAAASRTMTTYQITYIPVCAFSWSLNAGVIAPNAIAASEYIARCKATGRYTLEYRARKV